MLHPDRFNQTTQKAEWALANEMFKELNHAYDILKNPVKRNQYDYTIGSHGGHQSTYTNTSPQESRTEQQRPKQPAHTESSNYSNPAPWIRDTFRFFTILIFGNFRVAIFLAIIVYAFISPYCQKTETSHDNAPTVSTKSPPTNISQKDPNRTNTHPPSSFKSNTAMLAKLEENRVKMIKEATIADEALQNKARVDEEVGNLTELPYESAADARIAATRIQKLLPNYNPPKITRETDKELGTTVFYVEQPEINDKYVAPGTAPEMSETQTKVWNTLSDKVQQNPLIKNAIDADGSYRIVANSLDENNGFGDIAAINAFQRMVDPGVAVREGDVALLQTAIPRLKRLGLTVTNLVQRDRLTQEARDEIKKLANALAKTRINLGKQSILDLRQTAKLNKIDPDLVIRDFSIAPSKSELTKEIDVLSERMKSIPKSQANDPASQEMINTYKSLKTQLQQAK